MRVLTTPKHPPMAAFSNANIDVLVQYIGECLSISWLIPNRFGIQYTVCMVHIMGQTEIRFFRYTTTQFVQREQIIGDACDARIYVFFHTEVITSIIT